MTDTTEPVDNFEDLLELTPDDVVVPTEEPPKAPVKAPARAAKAPAKKAPPAPEDPEAARIRELEAMLAEPMPSFDEPEEEPEEPVELTEAEIRIKELEDRMAKRNAIIAENAPTRYAKAGNGEKVLIHFVYDGMIAFGQNWYRGQELEFEVGGETYKRTQDRNGASWLDLANNPNAQILRWGHHYFSPGPFVPFPGEKFDDDMVAQDARRARAVPLASI
jgi:hypothetical protein